jgi:hypothetical protein
VNKLVDTKQPSVCYKPAEHFDELSIPPVEASVRPQIFAKINNSDLTRFLILITTAINRMDQFLVWTDGFQFGAQFFDVTVDGSV